MMKCNDELVQLYVEGALGPAEAAIVAEHLKGCPTCRQQAGLYKGLLWDLAHPPRSTGAEAEVHTEALAALLKAEWQRIHPASSRTEHAPATIWLTANPVATASAHAVGRVGQAGLQGLGRVLKVGLARALGRKGGGNR